MKRSFALLLTSLLLVFSLTACVKDQQPGGVNDNGSVSGTDGSATDGVNGGDMAGDNNGPATGGVNGGDMAGGNTAGNGSGSVTDGVMDDVGDAARDAVRDTGDALTGGTAGYTNSRANGYTYDQMVQNGRVF